MRQTDARAIMDSGLDGVELAVALALWSYADDSGRCWPALRSLCRRSGWRERAVQRALRSLEAAGVLSVHHVPVRVTPTYVLHVAGLPAGAEVVADGVADDVAEGGRTTDTPGARETPPVSVVHPPVSNRHPPVSHVHPPVSVVHPNPSENPPEKPPLNPPDKSTSASPPPAAGAAQLSLLSGAVDEVKPKPPKPTKAAREVEAAADLLARLDAMRLERHPGGRPLRPETWLPEVRRALRRQTPQGVLDGWTWLLRSPDAAWHRGEDRGGQDRTRDLKLLVAHPEYADRRTWRGLEAGHEHDIEQREPEAIAAPVFALTPYQIAVAAREERERLENEELRRQKAAMLDAQGDDDDLPF